MPQSYKRENNMLKNDALPYAGSGVCVGSGILNHFYPITLSEIGVIVGILVAIGTILMNWYYKAKEDRRAEKLFQLHLQQQEKKTDEKT